MRRYKRRSEKSVLMGAVLGLLLIGLVCSGVVSQTSLWTKAPGKYADSRKLLRQYRNNKDRGTPPHPLFPPFPFPNPPA